MGFEDEVESAEATGIGESLGATIETEGLELGLEAGTRLGGIELALGVGDEHALHPFEVAKGGHARREEGTLADLRGEALTDARTVQMGGQGHLTHQDLGDGGHGGFRLYSSAVGLPRLFQAS